MRPVRATALALVALAALPAWIGAQSLPRTRADALLDAGRWSEAEDAYYAQSRARPRDPASRAALGRYLAMKGAVLPGTVLIDEARQFGLDERTARSLTRPLRQILAWRRAAGALRSDTSIAFTVPHDSTALFRIAFGAPGTSSGAVAAGGVWHDIVPRAIALDSVTAANRPIGVEVLELLVPAVDVRAGRVTLHANPRAALTATGRRYPVLRTGAGVQVLLDERRVVAIGDALRELAPAWWQLDLPHGLLVVR